MVLIGCLRGSGGLSASSFADGYCANQAVGPRNPHLIIGEGAQGHTSYLGQGYRLHLINEGRARIRPPACLVGVVKRLVCLHLTQRWLVKELVEGLIKAL